jgi:biopolymer transport protein ExbD
MPAEMMELKVVSLGKVYGPVRMETLVRLACGGRISADDQVRRSGEPIWMPVTEIPALAACLRQASVAGPDIEAEIGGARARFRRQAPEDLAMDMTPMIDVTFQLLIFFMLAHTWANLAAMEVPEAVHGRGVNLEGQQVRLIDDAGRYYLGDRPEPDLRKDSLDALVAEVEANAARLGGGPIDVIVHGHKRAKHKSVRDAVERLENAKGVGKIMLGIQEKHPD